MSRLALPSYLAGATLARTGAEVAGPAILLFGLAVSGSTQTAAFLYSALTIASAFGGPLFGALLDRVARPGRLIAAALVAYAVGIGIIVAGWDRVPTPLLFVVAVLTGTLYPALGGGWTAQVGRLVPAPLLRRAHSLDAATYNLAGLTGPAIAGILAGLLGAAEAVVAAIVLVALAVPPALTLPAIVRDTAERRSIAADVMAGLRAIATIPALRGVTLSSTLSLLAFGMVVVACPLLGAEYLGGEENGAFLLSVIAAAALLSTVVTARWPLPGTLDRVFIGSSVVVGVGMTVVALAPNAAIVVVGIAIVGLADGPEIAALFGIRHREAPDRLRAQVFSTGSSLRMTAAAIGAALAGVLAAYGITAVLATAAVLQFVATASGPLGGLSLARSRV